MRIGNRPRTTIKPPKSDKTVGKKPLKGKKPTITTKYAVGEESGGSVKPPTVTTEYAVGEESGGSVRPPTVTTHYAVGEESGGGVGGSGRA